ncbi:MAG: hypothetical protein F2738_07795 [Actinobacteria bacterium]|jgi:hypothetical protein|nr:hypothetical protein [Actinomycetota bacterium]
MKIDSDGTFNDGSVGCGESVFLRKIFPGFLLEKSEKNYAISNAFGCPYSSYFARFTLNKRCFA